MLPWDKKISLCVDGLSIHLKMKFGRRPKFVFDPDSKIISACIKMFGFSGKNLGPASALNSFLASGVDNLCKRFGARSGPEVLKHFSCSTQLSTKFQLLVKTKIPTSLSDVVFIMLITQLELSNQINPSKAR